MSFELSAKDKKLLVYLGSVIILALAYFFGTKPLLDKNDALNSQIATVQAEVDELTDIYNNQDTYADRIMEERDKFDEALEKFPGGLTQEYTLMLIQDIEDMTDTWISRVSFSEEQILSGSPAGEGEELLEEEVPLADFSDDEDYDGEDYSDEDFDVVDYESEAPEISAANIMTIRQDLSLDYSCRYDNFKEFIDYIQNYDVRLFISSINASYSPESNEVFGSVTLSQFAIAGAGKEVEDPDLSGLSLGTDNIFTTLNGTTGNEPLELGEVTLDEDGNPIEESEEGDEEPTEVGELEEE